MPSWSVTDHLLARAVDGIEHDAWLLAAVNTPRSKRSKHPAPVPRPMSHAEQRKQKSDWRAQLRASGAARYAP